MDISIIKSHTKAPPFTAQNAFAAPKKYHVSVRLFHWISAAVIVWATVTGVYASSLEDGALKTELSSFNVALTALFLPVFMTRVIVRLSTIDPEPISKHRLINRVAGSAHILLYLITSIVLISGVFSVDHDAEIFGFAVLKPVPISEPARAAMRHFHKLASYGLALLVVIHVGAVLIHQAFGRDVLHRMTL